ncbi:MAG TPA: ATP-dependent RecD-like DNA helicase [Candidatus Avoscillospira avistercoris]|uniref:ATP-dependent RecD2 DNA helicase n=1 Tax=Candidatus Avoscillospira avistercoris TaxID=2840707 RepID=A0A9D1F7R7_9FIRM|nr:ATP-dependent RecD-like DNA helicase [Candidatus Avoscillospira avistercoris]
MIRGSVSTIVYQNEENGYAVLRFDTEGGETITVVGTIPMTNVGERLVVAGKWSRHPAYGRQFEAEFLERLMPESASGIQAFLSSRAVKGIGAVMAKRIVEAFGVHALDVIENDPERLATLPGISEKKAQEMSRSFRRQVGIRRLIEFLSAHNLPTELALRLYRVYGEMAVDAIRDDPYLLTDSFFGATFGQVDHFAISLGVDGADERRVEAGICFELSHNLNNGHVFLPRNKLATATEGLLGLDRATIDEGFLRLQEQGRIALDRLAGMDICYLPELYEAEVYVAERLRDMVDDAPKLPVDLARLLGEVQANRKIAYARQQLEAITAAAEHRVVLVTGGPGTGKTTTLDGILDLFDRMKLKSLLAAPTGRAAKRLSDLTGREASTIHRLLEAQFDPETGAMVFTHNEDDPLDVEAVVVDETSMVDLQLMQSLLRALPPRCRLVLVGDPDQLPSVGPGNVFSDLIRSGVLPMVRLTEIFRQARESLIVMNAHAVNQGHLPRLTVKDRDFFFLKRRTAESVVDTICDLCDRRLPENMGIPPAEIQVLSPTRKQETGTVNLNKRLQAVLNPPAPNKAERQRGETVFREGDRVMQIRNNYDIVWKRIDGLGSGVGVFNGDMGVITTINHSAETLTVVFDDDRTASYEFDMLAELELAYAMTVHKSQGSEYRAVILTAWSGSPYLLSRSILYTAITRARQMLIIVGDESVIAQMTANDRQQRRYSGLKLRLQQREQQA